ncbi:MAG: BatD family protein [Colwellia sp.]
MNNARKTPFYLRATFKILFNLSRLSLLLMCLTSVKLAYANTIETLVEEDQLSVTAKIRTENDPIVGQPIILSIEVATNRWFSAGTRINAFKVADAVVLASSEIAINSSKRINSETWSTQTREITLYPTRQGEYQLPAIEVFISVNTEQYGIVEGTIFTEVQRFVITKPTELEGIKQFIVSPKVDLIIDGDFEQPSPYKIGEAITQTITISAQNTPAMMIPPLTETSIEGMSIYQKPVRVFDKSNRGSLLGTRIESKTYIFESAGSFEIEEQKIFWWNIQTQQLEQIVIPAQKWKVSGQALSIVTGKGWLEDVNTKTLSILLIALIFFLSAIWIIKRYKKALLFTFKSVTKQKQRKLASAFLQALSAEQYPAACQLLYRYHWLINKENVIPETPLLLTLNQQSFDTTYTEKPVFTQAQGKLLLKYVSALKKTKRTDSLEKNINLNKLI